MSPYCCFVPSEIFEHIAARGNRRQRRTAFENLIASAQLRGERHALTNLSSLFIVAPGVKRRTVYDAQNGLNLPGNLVRSEGDPKSKDRTVNEAFDGSGKVFDFYLKTFERVSIDGDGMPLDSTVHYRRNFSNAFWNGKQMVYGDGDGEIFQRFTKCIDVIGHELTHGVTQFEAGLGYTGQPGALNEHFSDVFGALVKQSVKKQKADEADWLIGSGLFTKEIKGKAIRSMKEPGTAYDDPLIGKDLQSAHMRDYVHTDEDSGGIHINSGIPNKAFYNLAVALGDYSWKKAGKIWYVTLVEKIRPRSNFQNCAKMTHEVAVALYGKASVESKAVKSAWAEVGIRIES